MSLLDQLKSISDNAVSTVVDRKSRSKIHSRSLIFEPKIAATQDFELIYDIGLEGLDELITFNKKFQHFKTTLFHETTVTFDRNVQTPDMLQDLNANINNFLLLISPLLNLNCSIKALEWLVRRFNINLYNGEMLLLISLSYYKNPLFVKFLNVIPKSSFPKIFESFSGFKELLKNPSMASIIKNFLNNYELFKLYSLFIIDQISKKLIFKDQLIFYLSISIQLLSTLSKDKSRIEVDYLPILLQLTGNLLLPGNVSGYDCKLTAFSLISIISSIVPLNETIILSLTNTIINNKECLSEDTVRKSVITLGQLWQNHLPETEDISIRYFTIDEDLIKSLIADSYNINKFLIHYYISNLNQLNHYKYFKYLSINDSNFKIILSKLLREVGNDRFKDKIVKDNVTRTFESLYKLNPPLFKSSTTIKIGDLEMILMTTLDNEIEADIEDLDENDIIEEIEEVEDIIENDISTQITSFFNNSSTVEFNQLAQALIVNLNSIEGFKTKFPTFESFISFLLRFALTSSLPIKARVKVLIKSTKIMSKFIKDNGKMEFYLLLPITLLGLYDVNKLIRSGFINFLNVIKVTSSDKKAKLFMEDEIYIDLPNNKKSMISPKQWETLSELVEAVNFDDLIVDRVKILDKLVKLFTFEKSGLKKFGSLYVKSFILNQWSLTFLPLSLKDKIWEIMTQLNKQDNDYRLLFNDDLINFKANRSNLIRESDEFKLSYDNMETNLIGLIGGLSINEKHSSKEIELILNLVDINPISVCERIVEIFPKIKYADLKFKIFNKLIDLLIEDDINESFVEFDPFEVLAQLKINFELLSMVLKTVQINNEIPDQSAKRKRRSSSQTKQNLARNDITSIASIHLKKLTIVLDLLNYNLTESLKKSVEDNLSCPELLIELFKILTDLDYLGNDGHLPILYSQEVLSSCMLNTIKLIKFKEFNYDSNSIRADLIVNSIRNSTSPQIQNKLLLVIAELASLAPEIILHSVMPIFTFMGAHTIKQDDEFSNSALQETVSRVIPALAKNGTTNVDEDIEFLLASFIAALQHIPRHRRNKLFSSLVKTLTIEKSLHIILFLVGNQFNKEIEDKSSLIEFSTTLLKNFNANDQLISFKKFLDLWEIIPNKQINKKENPELYNKLIKRPIFGVSLLSLTDNELINLKNNLFTYLNEIIIPKDDFNEINLLKLKINVQLLDDKVDDSDKQLLLTNFNGIISFFLKLINDEEYKDKFELLNNFLSMLPISYFIDSILESIEKSISKDQEDLKVSRNFVNLTINKLDNELNVNNINDDIIDILTTKFIPVLVKGIEANVDLLLQQSFIDCLSVVIHKLFIINNDIFKDTKPLIDILQKTLTQGFLSNKPELIISSVNLLNNLIDILGVKMIGFLPKIINPSFEIYDKFVDEPLIQTSILLLYSNFIKKLSSFLGNNIDRMLLLILKSDLVNNDLRLNILDLAIKNIDLNKLIKSLFNIWITKNFYQDDSPENLGLYLNCLTKTIENIDKKSAIANSSMFLKWAIKILEFRFYCEINNKFNNNTIFKLESSFYSCSINFILKLNDKNFRPIFASLIRWTIDGENSIIDDELIRLISFMKFFNKLQEELKSIITSYYSYLIEPVAGFLTKFNDKQLTDINLRRILLISLNLSFKHDQDDYWSQESRFNLILSPLVKSLNNIDDSIGKYLVKAITSFTANVSSDEYNKVILNQLIVYLNDDNDVRCKIWTVRTLKSIFQKLGESWLSLLPTLVPYIAELLDDDDESVELEVRKGLVRVIESVLGEPLDRYLD
ncbi:U3 small nucleolar RNA-associated protein 10 [[Candida] jaroonii]|uniref:U3 small nucleolar RNA-associated protein 10 n=1 Tax=[Candida] jaroonii TaxID=467808 RepID=A0ACA9Y1C8_9ASCO|nr:U3 small nucleolar RNA-associated protein 10 [[Candida] jaroonii]